MKRKAQVSVMLAVFVWFALFVATASAEVWLITQLEAWDPQNPVGSKWTMPDSTQRFIHSWDDTNGDNKVSVSDYLKFALVDDPTIVTVWWHVDEVGPDNMAPGGPDYLKMGRTELVPEFPLGLAMEIALGVAIAFLVVKKTTAKPKK